MIPGNSLSLRVWENGEFGASALPFKLQKRHPLKPFSPADECDRLLYESYQVVGFQVALENYANKYGCRPDQVGLDPFALSLVSKSHSGRKIRGQEGISTYGKKVVRNAALRLQRENDKRTLTFLTFTMPSLEDGEYAHLSANWAEICRVLFQRLSRMLRRKGLPGEFVSVTEIQEKRFRNSGAVALHLHIIFKGANRAFKWCYTPKEYRKIWREVLGLYLQKPLDSYYWDRSENCVAVKHSAEGYLGKYMSKGSAICGEIRESNPDIVFPSTWYNLSASLKKRVKKNVFYRTGEDANFISSLCSNKYFESVFKYLRPIQLDINDRVTGGYSHTITIGYCGRFRVDYLDVMQRLVSDYVYESVVSVLNIWLESLVRV